MLSWGGGGEGWLRIFCTREACFSLMLEDNFFRYVIFVNSSSFDPPLTLR